MTLFQFLRVVKSVTPLILFDIQKVEICRVLTKHALSSDYLEETVFEVAAGYVSSEKGPISCLFITLQK